MLMEINITDEKKNVTFTLQVNAFKVRQQCPNRINAMGFIAIVRLSTDKQL